MENTEKQQIAEEVLRLSKLSSQNKVATRVGVSSATISQILNNNWKLIKPEMWRKIKTRLKLDFTWKTAPTQLYKDLNFFANTAKATHITVAFAHKAGTGKSHFFNAYQKTVPNVIYVEGSRMLSKKKYIQKLLTNAGQDDYGTTYELFERFVNYMSELENPLIIIDQFDKLKENTFDLFMDLYNELQGSCGFIISGVEALEKRMIRGVKNKKIGYEEIFSRIDRKFIELYAVTKKDVQLLLTTNGITDVEAVTECFNTCNGDLRTVKKYAVKYKLNN